MNQERDTRHVLLVLRESDDLSILPAHVSSSRESPQMDTSRRFKQSIKCRHGANSGSYGPLVLVTRYREQNHGLLVGSGVGLSVSIDIELRPVTYRGILQVHASQLLLRS